MFSFVPLFLTVSFSLYLIFPVLNQSLAFQKKWRTQLSVMAIDAGKVEKKDSNSLISYEIR